MALLYTWYYFGCKFCCYLSRFMPEIVSKFFLIAVWSVCAVQLEREQMPFSQTDHWFGSVELSGSNSEHGNMLFCSHALLLLRDHWMIWRLSKVMSAALVSNIFAKKNSVFCACPLQPAKAVQEHSPRALTKLSIDFSVKNFVDFLL